MDKLSKNYSHKIERDKLYRRALNASDCGVWEWNIDTGEVFVSEKIKKIIGNDLCNIKTMYEFINNVVYSKDKSIAIKEMYEYINGSKPYYESAFRLKNKNSTWILIKGQILKKESEYYGLFSGIMSKVSENELNENLDEIIRMPNKLFFLKKVNYCLSAAKPHNARIAIIYIKIENFKDLSIIFDCNIGNIILRSFSQSIIRIIDEYGELGKIGEDEFAILIHKFDTIKDIKNICNKIHVYFQKPLKIMDYKVYMEVNMGVSVFPEHGSNGRELLKYSCFAMDNSKGKKKNPCAFFDKQTFDIYYRRILIENELKNSIFNDELEIYYQPQIDVLNSRIMGLEALLRWKNEKLGIISPEEFVPIMEDGGYIVQIGYWVLDKVICTIRRWKEKGIQLNRVAVNISPIQLKRSDFKNKLLGLCKKYDVSPSLLELEITEGTLLEMYDDSIKIFEQLVGCNINIALDDFGTRYSSLSYLLSLPVNTLKIDKLFVDNIQCKKNKILIRSIVELSKSLGCKVIVEGVETKEQVDILNSLGCNIIQGYYFSKPLSKKELEDILINKKCFRNKL